MNFRGVSWATCTSSALVFCSVACSGTEDPGSDITSGSGGQIQAQSGGAPGTGGASSSGGSATGGATTASGGAATGGASASGGTDGSGGATVVEFALMSTAWEVVNNDDCTPETTPVCPIYPEENTTFGENVSPQMSWVGAPEGTQSFAIVLYDLTNPNVHWAIWDIPANVTMLAAELPDTANLSDPAGAKQATGFGQMGYFGSGKCGNTYEHRLYALSVTNLAPPSDTAASVRETLEASSNVLGESFVRLQSRDYCTP
jgi:phosphatidylethanolamine-binding protein (PEBP) family uncharacterized protein